MKTAAILTFLMLSYQLNLKAQGIQAFDFVTWPHSVSAFGSGEMGVASLTNDDALVYNPAKLSLTKNSRFSFYRFPYQIIGFYMPLTSYTLYHNVPGVGSFAVNYENQNFGEFVKTSSELDPNGQIVELGRFNSFNTALAFGYAKNFNDNFSAGVELRYSYWNFGEIAAQGFFLSLGGLYTPDFCNRKLTFGFSLMNLGPAVKFESSAFIEGSHFESPPAKLNLGISFTAAENNYFSFPLSLGISKPFDKTDDNYEGQSSFKTLFTDWKDFPNDAALHTGLSFIWKPLYFSDNFAFFQEFYAGNVSGGIKTALQNYFVHGMNMGIEFYGFKFSAGYSGISHNARYLNYIQYIFPYETFQFALEMNNDLLFSRNNAEAAKPLLDHAVLSLGIGQTLRVGFAKKYQIGSVGESAKNSLNYSIEGAFYFNKNNALVSSIIYNRIIFEITFGSFTLLKSKYETFSFYTSYRYHPLEEFHNLFLQGGLGIFRINPVILSEPRYDYKTALQSAAGLMLDFGIPVIITPIIDYNLILFPASGDAPRIRGYNQFNFNLKFGYKIF